MGHQWDHVPDAAELAEVYRKHLDEQAKRIAELQAEVERLKEAIDAELGLAMRNGEGAAVTAINTIAAALEAK